MDFKNTGMANAAGKMGTWAKRQGPGTKWARKTGPGAKWAKKPGVGKMKASDVWWK